MSSRTERPGAPARRAGLRVLFLTEGEPRRGLSPAARYRVGQYVPGLEALGVDCVVAPCRPTKYVSQRAWHRRLADASTTFSRVSHLSGPLVMAVKRLVVDLPRAIRADVTFIQRDLLPTYPPLLERLLAKLGPTVFDMDDAIHLVPEGESRLVRLTRDEDKIEKILGMVTTTTVGNHHLHAYASRHARRTARMPTTVDTDTYQPTRERGGDPVVLWTGTSSNLPSLEAIGTSLLAAHRAHRFVLRVVCDARPRLPDGLQVDFRRWSLDTERRDLSGAAVGLMPLADTPWNRGKCALKLLLYGALGLPSVASPVGANVDVVTDGTTGHLADTPGEWTASLITLLRDHSTRRRMGRAARTDVVDDWSVRAWTPRFAQILRETADG